MMTKLSIAAALLLLSSVGFAAAQTAQPPPGGPPPDTSTKPKDATEQNPSAQHTQQPEQNNPTGAQVAPGEPKSVSTPQTGPAFVNGALAAPGADKDAQTVPAKFSAKNDAEDHLPVIAFTFKNMSDEQKRAIVASVKDAKTSPPKGPAAPEAYATPSMQLPALSDIRALPDSITSQMPELKPYRYATIGDKVLLVAPTNMVVVSVLGQ
jgi:hypothetical protein